MVQGSRFKGKQACLIAQCQVDEPDAACDYEDLDKPGMQLEAKPMHDEACDPTTRERNKPEDNPHRYELCIEQIQQQ